MQPTPAIRDIRLVIDLGGELKPAALALDLAGKLDAHLTGIALAFQPIIPAYTMAAPVPTDFIVSAHDHAIADAKAAGERFTAMAEASDADFETRSIDSMPGDGFASAVRHFQLADLAVVGQQNPDRPEPMREGLIEAILFRAGAPVLLAPHSGASAFKPDRVVIAWDGGALAARAVRTGLPLLSRAGHVDAVIVAEDRKLMDAPGAGIGRHLARHGLDVEIHEIAGSGGDVASAILAFAAERRADWILMGAYGHRRVREFFLGGVTSGMLLSAALPIFMVH